MGIYVKSGHPAPVDNWLVMLIGSCPLLGYFLYPAIDSCFFRAKKYKSVIYIIVRRCCLCVFGVLTLGCWRGVWSLSDHYLGPDPIKALLLTICSFLILAACGACRTAIYVPVSLCLDTTEDTLVPTPCFCSKV